MKLVLASLASLAVAALAGCATQSAPTGMAPGKFVSFACADGKTFSARAAEGGDSVRVRAHQGSAELDRKGDGVYEGDGYKLVTQGAEGVSLTHEGKPQGKNCKVAA
ncbi:hypothetical protein [Caenimonas soli]|uniref:hypothetical protein n=1 Tax=Caenimonas soli TaxID=2735555 RepID=UPI0015563B49|nr:hypothetical protein [Caenimonas soli]NPC54436.1 hypothetical protein [Caenimonas soli]